MITLKSHTLWTLTDHIKLSQINFLKTLNVLGRLLKYLKRYSGSKSRRAQSTPPPGLDRVKETTFKPLQKFSQNFNGSITPTSSDYSVLLGSWFVVYFSVLKKRLRWGYNVCDNFQCCVTAQIIIACMVAPLIISENTDISLYFLVMVGLSRFRHITDPTHQDFFSHFVKIGHVKSTLLKTSVFLSIPINMRLL